MTVLHHIATVLAIIDPGEGAKPPGGDKIITIVRWIAWAVFGCCVAGALIAAGKIALAHHRGHGGGGEASSLAWVLFATVVAGSASALVGALA